MSRFQELWFEMGKRIASLISNIFNPFLVSLVLILLVSFESTTSTLDAVKWSLILIALSILPIYLVVIYLVRKNKIDGIFVRFRRQRNKLYALAVILAGASCIILFYLNAPLIMIALFVTEFFGTAIFMGINLRWKISLHTAFVATSAMLLVILYGPVATVAVVLVPLIAWTRLKLELHSLAQVVTGAFLAATIMVVVFYLFGLI